MDAKINEVKLRYPNVKYVTICADFSKMHTIKDYKEKIASKLINLDVCMLFLNAGSAQMGKFADIDESSVEDIMTVNAIHPMYLAKALIN